MSQRRRSLEEQRTALETQRATIENEMATASTAHLGDLAGALDRVERRLAEIDTEMRQQSGTDEQTRSYHRAVDLLGQWTGTLQRDVRGLENRLERWAKDEADARTTRQEELDATLEDLHDLVRDNGAERREQIRRVDTLILLLMVMQMAMGIAIVVLYVRLAPLMELWR